MLQDLGERVRRLRLARGLTQQELAAKAGVGPCLVSDIEQGKKRRPYPKTIHKLAAALEVSPEYLLGVDDGGVRR